MTRDSRPAGRNRTRATSRPAANRPAANRRGTTRPGSAGDSSGRESATGRLTALRERSRRRPQSMKRMTILGALLIFLAVVITPTLNSYLQQKHQIGQLGAQVEQQQSEVKSQQTELKRWTSDPAFVKQQARDRLGFVTPGQTLTVLVDESGNAVGTADPSGKKISTNPWYGQIWQSAVAANRGSKK